MIRIILVALTVVLFLIFSSHCICIGKTAHWQYL